MLAKIGRQLGIDLPYFVKYGAWAAGRHFTAAVVGLGLSMAFARLVSQTLFGQYQLILSIMALVSIISLPGLQTSLLQSIARGNDGDYLRAIKKRLHWSMLGLPILIIIGLYYYRTQSHQVGLALMLSAIFFPGLQTLLSWDNFLHGKQRFDIAAIYGSTAAMVTSLVTIAAIIWRPGNLIIILGAYLLSNLLINIFLFQRSRQYITNQKTSLDLISYGYFLTKINILGIIVRNLDNILVATLLGVEQLAIYAIGVRFAKSIHAFLKGVLGITNPKIAARNTLTLKNYGLAMLLSVITTAVLLFSAPPLIRLLFSARYNDSIIISQIVIIFLPFWVLFLLLENHALMYLKDRGLILINTLLMPALSAATMVPLLILWQIKGLAISVGLQSVIGTAILLFLFRRKST
ncbi:MAG: oligosaccharide flippase family protein [bacterium]